MFVKEVLNDKDKYYLIHFIFFDVLRKMKKKIEVLKLKRL